MSEKRIGIIGGSGVYELDGVEYFDEVNVQTPYGSPSDLIRLGRFAGRELAFLPRHGRTHRLSPANVPYSANIYALKKLGVEWLLSINAVGSLQLDMKPLDFVIPDQLIDRTRRRPATFFDPIAVHVSLADPFCENLRRLVIDSARQGKQSVHERGTYICMEGPSFSTRAESNLYRSWGAHLIGMTAMPEARLAREAELCYAVVAMVTDYDCWHEENVDVNMIVANLHKNADNVKRLIKTVIPRIPAARDETSCSCASALKTAIFSRKEDFPAEKREAFEFLMMKYL